MNNLRYLTTVLALVNAGLTAQVAAASNAGDYTSTSKNTANKVSIGTE